jgi:hypothetical protein
MGGDGEITHSLLDEENMEWGCGWRCSLGHPQTQLFTKKLSPNFKHERRRLFKSQTNHLKSCHSMLLTIVRPNLVESKLHWIALVN